jgi:hypothetical protein
MIATTSWSGATCRTSAPSRSSVSRCVDRFPSHSRRSARVHHGSPLSWPELGFVARRLTPTASQNADEWDTEPMTWRPSHESDTTKELWLHFANEDDQFPLYPGQRTIIEHAYHVGREKWGPWFARAIQIPTRELHIQLDFAADTQVAVWGTVSSLAAESTPLSTPIQVTQDADQMKFTWSVRSPALGAAYRFEWRFR